MKYHRSIKPAPKIQAKRMVEIMVASYFLDTAVDEQSKDGRMLKVRIAAVVEFGFDCLQSF